MAPVVLFFVLGVIAKVARSDLWLPESMYEALSIYLLRAIGLKGGVELAQQPVATALPQALAVIVLGAAIPFLLFPVLHRVGRLAHADAASIAAHYGAVSVVTFAVALSYLLKDEAVLEKQLIRDARQFGAHGYTIYDMRGGGERGERSAEWGADRLVEMKVICDEAVAGRPARHVLASDAPHYAVTPCTADVGVFRPQKF